MSTQSSKRTTTHNVWYGMLARCLNPNHPAYYRYGGRGITVCPRWRGQQGFANFLADMGERPKGRSLDRINNDGNYEPGNCRWATYREQALNQRRNVRYAFKGEQLTLGEWSERLGVPLSRLDGRIRNGWSFESAATLPFRHLRPDRVGKPRREHYANGEDHHGAKITVDDVREIRRLAATGMTQKAIARQFGIVPSNVRFIIARKTWRHV